MLWLKDHIPAVQNRYYSVPESDDLLPVLLQQAFESDEPAYGYKGGRDNELDVVVPPETLIENLEKELTLVAVRDFQTTQKTCYFAKDMAFLRIVFNKRGKHGWQASEIDMISSSREHIIRIRAILDASLKPIDNKLGQIYMLKSEGGYSLEHLGQVGNPLVRDNYEAGVLKNYDHIVRDLNSSDPCGRLVVISGVPGCGKTWMLRALMCEVPKARFVLVPPSILSQIGDPSLLPALKTESAGLDGPLVLILEDADEVLLPRMGDNIRSIQGMLNSSDGLIGSVLDVRIIATTNADKFAMEPALMRPGRLCSHLAVDPLPPHQALEVYKRLTKQDQGPATSFTKKTSLADVYLAARHFGV